jgi:hypothetical protein
LVETAGEFPILETEQLVPGQEKECRRGFHQEIPAAWRGWDAAKQGISSISLQRLVEGIQEGDFPCGGVDTKALGAEPTIRLGPEVDLRRISLAPGDKEHFLGVDGSGQSGSGTRQDKCACGEHPFEAVPHAETLQELK